MTYRNSITKVFFISTFLLSCIALPAQVMWNFKGGIMPITAQHVDKDDEYRLNWMAGLEIEIPLSKMLNLETGLRYKNEVLCFGEYDDNDVTNHLELPVRLTYKQKLGNNLSLHTGIGPYVDAITLVSGIEPSIVVNWKSLSFGVTYNNPCFYKGGYNGDIKINSGLMLTLGIRFHSRAWKYIGPGLLAAGAVAGTVYAATQGNNSDSNYSQNSSSYSNYSDYSSSYSSKNNTDSKTCQSCKGSGLCRYCKGSGQGVMEEIGTNVHKKCPYCHGKKYCQDCKGKRATGITRQGSSNTDATCRECGGSTKCTECNGAGWNTVDNTPTTCWRCKGKRTCQACNGTGKR